MMWLARATLVALAASASASPAAAPIAASGASAPQVGRAAPDFSLRSIDGTTRSLSSYRGSVLILNVWATWCPPCRQEMPDFIASSARFAKQGVAFLAIDTTETAPIVRAYAGTKAVPFPIAVTPNGDFAQAYDVRYFPTTFVIDGDGIVRARYAGVLDARRLGTLVAAARQHRNAASTGPAQQKIDAMLAQPGFSFVGDGASVEATAKRAEAAVSTVENTLSDTGVPDLARTRSEENALLERAIAALVEIGTSVSDKTLLTRLRARVAANGERWSDAVQDYRAVVALDPANAVALAGLAEGARETGDRKLAIEAFTKLRALDPSDAVAAIALGNAQNEDGARDDAYATFAAALDAGARDVAAKPGDAQALRLLASAELYAARAHATNGDAGRGRKLFTAALATAQRLPALHPGHDMFIEQAQEGLISLDFAEDTPRFGVTLAPWTGPDLPGSVPDTIKYRLAVTAAAGKSVKLEASSVPPHWIASFCSDTVCEPKRTTVSIPPSGVKLVEFQLVPPQSRAAAPKVRVTGTDGATSANATT